MKKFRLFVLIALGVLAGLVVLVVIGTMVGLDQSRPTYADYQALKPVQQAFKDTQLIEIYGAPDSVVQVQRHEKTLMWGSMQATVFDMSDYGPDNLGPLHGVIKRLTWIGPGKEGKPCRAISELVSQVTPRAAEPRPEVTTEETQVKEVEPMMVSRYGDVDPNDLKYGQRTYDGICLLLSGQNRERARHERMQRTADVVGYGTVLKVDQPEPGLLAFEVDADPPDSQVEVRVDVEADRYRGEAPSAGEYVRYFGRMTDWEWHTETGKVELWLERGLVDAVKREDDDGS